MRRMLFWAPLVACALLFHFKNLGSTSLWQDEAETAVLARHTLHFGVPKVFDGLNLVSQNLGTDHDEHGVWNYSPWLGIYLTAASFALFGESNVTARLPFVLASLVTLLFLYKSARRWSGDRRVAGLAIWLNLLSVPFLLHARQCRYYVLDALFALYFYYAYETLVHENTRRRTAGFHFIASSLLLFHSNFLVFFAVAGGVFIHFMLFVPGRGRLLRRHVWTLALLILSLAPAFAYFHIFSRAGGEEPRWIASRWWNLRYYAPETDLYLFPALLVPLFALERRRWAGLLAPLCYIGGGLVFLCLAPHHFFRYLVTFIPLCSYLLAELFWRNFDRGYRVAACALLATLVFSHGLSLAAWKRGRFRSELADFAVELSQPIREPIAAATELLNAQAGPGELLLVSYPDLPFMFYTKLRVVGGRSGPHAIRPADARWVLLRDDRERAVWPLDFRDYDKLPLDAPNWPWGNRPDPDLHFFRTATTPEPAFIYRRQ